MLNHKLKPETKECQRDLVRNLIRRTKETTLKTVGKICDRESDDKSSLKARENNSLYDSGVRDGIGLIRLGIDELRKEEKKNDR